MPPEGLSNARTAVIRSPTIDVGRPQVSDGRWINSPVPRDVGSVSPGEGAGAPPRGWAPSQRLSPRRVRSGLHGLRRGDRLRAIGAAARRTCRSDERTRVTMVATFGDRARADTGRRVLRVSPVLALHMPGEHGFCSGCLDRLAWLRCPARWPDMHCRFVEARGLALPSGVGVGRCWLWID